MRQWGMAHGCVLCGERDETRDHLYFACPYSYTVWEVLARQLIGNGVNPDWQWTITRLQRMSDKGLDTILARMLFQSTVDNVWRERNARRRINKAKRNRIVSIRYKLDHKYGGLLRR
ncbi:hypothetical protein N665_0573s0030 [Sinapis alba]|nr:hypothetical protein N665_0573s0030 [Sinapis alba]